MLGVRLASSPSLHPSLPLFLLSSLLFFLFAILVLGQPSMNLCSFSFSSKHFLSSFSLLVTGDIEVTQLQG